MARSSWSTLIPKSASGFAGAASTLTPELCEVRNELAMPASSSAWSSAASPAMSKWGFRFRCVATWPNWRSRSTSSTGSRPLLAVRVPPASRTAVLTAKVVVPTPPLGEMKTMISPAGCPDGAPVRMRPARMRSASTRASSSLRTNSAATTSSAPASRNAMCDSTSPAGAITSSGAWLGDARRIVGMAPETASPSATIRSMSASPRMVTASPGVSARLVA